MELRYVPLLAIQRDLHRGERGPERFREYLRTMISAETGDLRLPLVAMNPMARQPVAAFLDRLLEGGAEEAGAAAVEEGARRLAGESGAYRVGLVVSDDAGGGWTDRAAAELAHRFASGALQRRGWIAPLLWTGDAHAAVRAESIRARVREALLQDLHRAAYVSRAGPASTLGEMLAQETWVMRASGGSSLEPELEAPELLRTREVLAPLLGARDSATQIAALFGDDAALRLGHRPLGLAPRAGLALAAWESRAGG